MINPVFVYIHAISLVACSHAISLVVRLHGISLVVCLHAISLVVCLHAISLVARSPAVVDDVCEELAYTVAADGLSCMMSE